jgi:hypothetical protein
METMMATGDNDEPKPEPTEAEKVAQYRIDYRETLKSIASTVAAKITRDVLFEKMRQV